MRLSVVVMLIVGSIASTVGVKAYGSEKPARLPALSARPSASVLARFDTNRDGTLDVAERAAMRQDIQQRMKPLRDVALKQYDWNKNGLLEEDERLAMQQDRQARHAQVEKWALQQYDANQNGVLEPAEQQVRKATREEWLRQKQSQILQTFDANRNGTLDPEERTAIHKKSQAARQAALDLYDSNRDGRIDDGERAMALDADATRAGRTQARAGASGGRAESGAAPAKDDASTQVTGPPLSNLRVSPVGGTSYAQGAEIGFTLGQAGSVRVRIHDAAGRLVRTLAAGTQSEAGAQTLRWDGLSSSGHAVANGIYLVTVEVPGAKATRKMAFIR